MAKLTIQEAADHFKVSKEAVHNRIRRGTLASIVEHGVKYVIVDDVKKDVKTSAGDDKYYAFLEEQNKTLQEKVERLERNNSSLRDQKEQMLIEERIKIENIYKEKDEQLKSILQTISTKFLAQSMPNDISSVEIIDVSDEGEISLKKYLKSLGLKQKRQEKVIARFKKLASKDDRIIIKENKLFVNPKKYGYSDII
ncbi:DNA-binding protein [Sulfurimonas sp. HSL-1716]|uniref:DNA-binding protein n=1 Tax=Hydrocurvibacter sulfurireducens TaxID=3131937 RepID=UPI0031F861DA